MKLLLAFSSAALLLSSGLRADAILHVAPTTRTTLSVLDSVGVERRDGKFFVLHRVNQSQTLYAIARHYNTSVDVIKTANPGLTDGVKYNQLVRIPQPEPQLNRKEEKAAERATRREEKEAKKAAKEDEQLMKKSEPAAKVAKNEPKEPEKPAKKDVKEDAKAAQRLEADLRKNTDVHVVESGQTLYSIAVKNKVLMVDIRRWNNLNSDNILVGQALIVSEKGFAARQAGNDAEPATPPAKAEPKPDITKKEPAKPTPAPRPTDDAPGRSPMSRPAERPDTKSETARSESKEEKPTRPGDPGTKLPTKGKRVAEIGMAETIEADESASKYLALHRSAPVGSLVQVRNDVSNQSLWVKVIGRLPNTGVNERVLIKLSAKAFEKLSPNNQSFRAEVSYMVP